MKVLGAPTYLKRDNAALLQAAASGICRQQRLLFGRNQKSNHKARYRGL